MTKTLTDYPSGSNLDARSFPSKREDIYHHIFPTLFQGSSDQDKDGVSSSSSALFRNHKNNCLQVCFIITSLIFNVAFCNQPLKDAEIGADGAIPQQKLEGTKFTIMRKRLNQAEALAACEKIHAKDRLAVLPDYNAAYFVAEALTKLSTPYTPEYDEKDNLTEFGLDRRYWIGLVDYFEEGEWVWLKSDGLQLEYDFWLPPQPDHIKPGSTRKEHCVTLWNPNYYIEGELHTFNDENCLNEHYFICEKHSEAKQKGKSFSLKVDYDIGETDDNGTLPFGVTIEHTPVKDADGQDISHESDEDDFQNLPESALVAQMEMDQDDYRQQTNLHIFASDAENQTLDTSPTQNETDMTVNDDTGINQNEDSSDNDNANATSFDGVGSGESPAETAQQKREIDEEDQKAVVDDDEETTTPPVKEDSEEQPNDETTTSKTTPPASNKQSKTIPRNPSVKKDRAKRLLKDLLRDY